MLITFAKFIICDCATVKKLHFSNSADWYFIVIVLHIVFAWDLGCNLFEQLRMNAGKSPDSFYWLILGRSFGYSVVQMKNVINYCPAQVSSPEAVSSSLSSILSTRG